MYVKFSDEFFGENALDLALQVLQGGETVTTQQLKVTSAIDRLRYRVDNQRPVVVEEDKLIASHEKLRTSCHL